MNISGKKNPTDSPCIGVCSTALGDEICVGCLRTFDEVRLWNTMTDSEKCAVNVRLYKVRCEMRNEKPDPLIIEEFACV